MTDLAQPEGDVSGDPAQQTLFATLGLDLDGLATVLAVHSVRVVAFQAAFVAFVIDLGWLEDRPGETHKKSHTKDHDKNRQNLAARRVQRDVAKAGRRQRCHREIERVDVIGDACFFLEAEHVNDRGGHEDEHKQVDRGQDGVLMYAKKPEIAAQIAQQVIGVNKSQAAQDPKYGEVLAQ